MTIVKHGRFCKMLDADGELICITISKEVTIEQPGANTIIIGSLCLF